MLVSSIGRFSSSKTYNSAFSGDKNSQTLDKCKKPCLTQKVNSVPQKATCGQKLNVAG